jgi:hypothetical protein
MNFEDELRYAMRRVDAPDGFATRVVAKAIRQSQAAARTTGHVPPQDWWLAAGLAASLVAAVGGGLGLLEHRRAAEARQARDLALQALRLASAQLNEIHARVSTRGNETPE